MFNPQVTTYQWTGKTSQQVTANQIFLCLLVDRNDHANYCMGELKEKPNGNLKPLTDIAVKMKEGVCFRFSKVTLADSKQEYISSPKNRD